MADGKTCEAPDKGLLDGIRVVEFGQGLACHLVGMLLGEQGAEVIRIRDTSRPAPADPVQDAMMARGKTEVPLDLSADAGRESLRKMVSLADIAVEDLPAGDLRELGVDYETLRLNGNPGLIRCSLPAFTEGDPRANGVNHEALVGTAGYLYEKPLGPPLYHDFPIGSVIGGLFGAISVVSALIARQHTGRGQDGEVSLYHSNLFAQILLILMKTGIPRGFLPLKMIGTPFMGCWHCGDGRWIYLHITLPLHNAQILDVLEGEGYEADVKQLRATLSEETMRDPSQVGSIAEAKKIRRIYERIFLTKSADEWEKVLGGDLCCIKARTVDEWLQDSMDAGMSDACKVDDPDFGELLGPGPAVTSPDYPPIVRPRNNSETGPDTVLARWAAKPPAPVQAGAADAPTTDIKHPLQGIRVMDLSRVIAGPCAARVLAELGAEVVSLQSPTELDWALSFHLLFNPGKKSATLDFTDEEGKKKLWAIMEDFQPDALIQNYRHLDIARAAGVDPEAVRGHFPDIVYTHLNAYGNEGVWRDRPGFEQVVQAVSGIQMSYGKDGKPRLLPTPVIDIGSGLTGALATVLGLYHRAATGHGIFATTHLTRTSVLMQVPWVSGYQRDKCIEAARAKGNEVAFDPGRLVTSGIHKARGGRVCVAGPWDAIRAWALYLGADETAVATDPLKAAADRLKRKRVDHWERTLRDAGVGDSVGVIARTGLGRFLKDLAAYDPSPRPMAFRRDYPGCPSQLTFVGNPIRLSDTPVKEVDPPPMRGQNTREVLARIGVEVPEGTGSIPYPPNRPFLIWLSGLIRWGYFAWRSGNI